VEQSTEHTGLVHLHLGVDGQHGVFTDPHCQAGHGCCCFANAFIEFGIQGVVAGAGGPEVYEVLDELEREVTDRDAWGAAQVLAHDVGLL